MHPPSTGRRRLLRRWPPSPIAFRRCMRVVEYVVLSTTVRPKNDASVAVAAAAVAVNRPVIQVAHAYRVYTVSRTIEGVFTTVSLRWVRRSLVLKTLQKANVLKMFKNGYKLTNKFYKTMQMNDF